MNTALDLLYFTIPTLISLIIVYLIVSKFNNKETAAKRLELLQSNHDTAFRMRLQAYERLAMLVERTHPRQLIPRVYTSGMTVQELQQALVITINAEFEHNLSQQIYVTAGTWQLIRIFKEQEINMIKHIASTLNPAESASVLHQQIVNYLITTESETPAETAMQAIQAEAKSLLTQGI
ncbi:MAG: hypothetical protein EBR55_03235 [Chitinophagia bacterium]|jgi:hypothetical protein|nr:hypothetical protein [Chitinophagia bacterium]